LTIYFIGATRIWALKLSITAFLPFGVVLRVLIASIVYYHPPSHWGGAMAIYTMGLALLTNSTFGTYCRIGLGRTGDGKWTRTTCQQPMYRFYSVLGAVCTRIGSQRFTQNTHSLQKIVIMAPTFNGIELEDGNAAVAEDQVTRCLLTFCVTADHNVWLPNL
jgi:hypothetical protein